MIQPTRTAGGIAALALLFATAAHLLLVPAAALAAGSLALFLFWRGWRFERNLVAVVTSLAVTRDLDRTILRQGATASVRVRVDCTVPAGMTVHVRDVPPVVAVGDSPLCESGEAVAYTIRLMAPGETAFGGIELMARDAFFTRTLPCRRFDAPHLRAFPVGIPEAGRGIGSRGEGTEVNRKAALAGQDIRGFRAYQRGDDPRLVDWKVTARRDSLYVREPTGLEGGAPLIAVDLPTGDLERFSRFSMAVYGAIEGAITSPDGCSLLVVAGPGIVGFLPRVLSSQEAFAVLGGAGHRKPHTFLYRAPGPVVLAERARVNGRGMGPEEQVFCERLGGVLSTFAGASSAPFATAVRAVLDRARATDIWVYSLLLEGDRSHLIQLIHEAKVQGMRVTLRAPAGAGTLPGVDAVEDL
ncbi:MAG: DUF58 domain-containing protein [Methanoculleus sp.]